MRTCSFWLRLAAIVEAFFAAGHFMGGLSEWSPMGDNPVLMTMKAVHFNTMGVSRSYDDFFMGFGHSLTVGLLTQTGILWFMASLARSQPRAIRPMIVVMLASALAGALISWRFIFPVPALFALVMVAILAVALVLSGRGAGRE